jgi:glutathione-regulated potassium-efflux system ancillary protein KefG
MNRETASHPVLILFGHPAIQKSRVNRILIRGIQDLPGITFHDLYDAYPDLDIDVPREQGLLLEHEIIVLHHPFYWYSTPAIIKEWEDLVLTHGWAYGREGTALGGKTLLSAITTGGREEAYQKGGHNRFTIRELLAPIEQTARLCGMTYLPPFVVHGTHLSAQSEIERHAGDYRRLLEALRDGTIDIKAAHAYPRLNSDPDAILIT